CAGGGRNGIGCWPARRRCKLERAGDEHMGAAMTRAVVESFLYKEARLLDEWRLTEWEQLFTDDGRYLVPPVGIDDAEHADSARMLFLIADDRVRIKQRVLRLLKTSAHAEYPHSRTRHMITNVELLEQDGQGTRVSAYFSVYRVRRREVIVYMGQLFYRLVRVDDSLAIQEKRACLDLDALAPQGTLAFIL
ncbi:MAG: aromatic-ring-hydroxylating dioxygenase subunit beta, partial [Steroidobacteraceae bacterium]